MGLKGRGNLGAYEEVGETEGPTGCGLGETKGSTVLGVGYTIRLPLRVDLSQKNIKYCCQLDIVYSHHIF